MATRLLFWNIENFGQNKIQDPDTREVAGVSPANLAYSRSWLIQSIIRLADPQIFVVVEVETGKNDSRGQLTRSNPGSRTLLSVLQELNQNWRLVPPLRTGPSESVAVYYRQETLIFSGPGVWPGGSASTAALSGRLGNYPHEYSAGLGDRKIPDNALFNPEKKENQAAARIRFNENRDQGRRSGRPIDYSSQRAPYMTTFAEIDPGNPKKAIRDLTIFSIHSPASFNAKQYLKNLATVGQITDDLKSKEVRVIAGDFNWNLLDNAWNQRTSYNNLVDAGYKLELVPPNPPASKDNGFPWYFATHLSRKKNAVYWSTQQRTAYYPGYLYFSANDFALDNIYTRYGAEAKGPASNFTILNPVVGSGYDKHAVPVNGTPEGSLPLKIFMDGELYANPPETGPQYADNLGINNNFRDWLNFGRIRSTSDHLPLAIDL